MSAIDHNDGSHFASFWPSEDMDMDGVMAMLHPAEGEGPIREGPTTDASACEKPSRPRDGQHTHQSVSVDDGIEVRNVSYERSNAAGFSTAQRPAADLKHRPLSGRPHSITRRAVAVLRTPERGLCSRVQTPLVSSSTVHLTCAMRRCVKEQQRITIL